MTNERVIVLESGNGNSVRFEFQPENGWYYMKSNTGYRTIKKIVEATDIAKTVKNYERRGFVKVEA